MILKIEIILNVFYFQKVYEGNKISGCNHNKGVLQGLFVFFG